MKKFLLRLIFILISIVVLIVINKDANYNSIISALIGVLIGAYLVPLIEKLYRKEKSMKMGIETIKHGKPCIIDELEIMLSPKIQENSLIVSNMQKWIYKVKTDNADSQLDLLVSDFEVLRKKSNWKEFIANKTIIFNLYSDESLDEEIIKTIEKTYD